MSGALSALSALRGFLVDMPAAVNRTRIVAAPALAQAIVNFNRDGTITNDVGGSLGDWISPKHSTVGDAYEVKYDYGSGDVLSSGASASGTWIALTANRSYENQATSAVRTTNLTWSIRLASGSILLDTATGQISAQST